MNHGSLIITQKQAQLALSTKAQYQTFHDYLHYFAAIEQTKTRKMQYLKSTLTSGTQTVCNVGMRCHVGLFMVVAKGSRGDVALCEVRGRL